jgi:hypothetical protein
MLPAEEIDFVSAVVEAACLENTIAGLEEHHQSPAWWSRLFMVLGTFPLPPDLAPRLDAIIVKTDFAATAADDTGGGHIPLHIACEQSKNTTSQTVRAHLIEALYSTAAVFARHREMSKPDDVALLLLDCALSLAQGSASDVRTMDEFASIVERLARTWSILARVARSGVQRLCEEVPYGETEGLWRLNLALRARK